MDEETRRALLLRLSGHSVADIANELGLPDAAAEALLERGEQELATTPHDPSPMLRTAEAFAERRRQGTFRSADFTRPLVTALARELKPRGFRRKGASIFREAEPGLLHTVNIQSGSHFFSEPSLTYGQFTVNLSVDVQEVFDFDASTWAGTDAGRFGPGRGSVAYERLGFLMAGEDIWWPMEGDPAASARMVLDGLESHGFAFFEPFGSRTALEDAVQRAGRPGISRPVPLLVAALRLGRGDRTGAGEILREYVGRADLAERHRSWVRDLIARLGL